MQHTTTTSSQKRWLRSTASSEAVQPAGSSSADADGACRSGPPRVVHNQPATQNRPSPPIQKNGRLQLPMAGVSIAATMIGVTIAPIDVPLCRMLLPNARSSGARSCCVVFSAQGQCPDSKNPSSVRQNSKALSGAIAMAVDAAADGTSPVRKPISDHSANTSAYSQRTLTRSTSRPKVIEPTANA